MTRRFHGHARTGSVLGPLVVAFLSAYSPSSIALPLTLSRSPARRRRLTKSTKSGRLRLWLKRGPAPAVVPTYVPPEPPAPQPMTSLPVDQIFRELPGLLEGLFKRCSCDCAAWCAVAKELDRAAKSLRSAQLGRRPRTLLTLRRVRATSGLRRRCGAGSTVDIPGLPPGMVAQILSQGLLGIAVVFLLWVIWHLWKEVKANAINATPLTEEVNAEVITLGGQHRQVELRRGADAGGTRQAGR
jgi:hypothetical protein